MPLPVGGSNLVADQLIDGLGIGDAQQRLGETHQSHALLRGQDVFVQKGVEPAAADPLPAHGGYEPARGYAYPVARLGRQFGGDGDAHTARRADPGKLPARAQRDITLRTEIRRVYEENSRVYGLRKVWRQLLREGTAVARSSATRSGCIFASRSACA